MVGGRPRRIANRSGLAARPHRAPHRTARASELCRLGHDTVGAWHGDNDSPSAQPTGIGQAGGELGCIERRQALAGAGAGWLAEEMRAVGVSPINRGARTNEYIDSMRSLWTDKAPSYRGEYVSFDAVDAHPRPVRAHGPHVVIGGTSDPAFRRTVARGNSWYGIGNGPTDLTKHLDGLHRVAAEVDRPAHLGRLEINFLHLDPDTVDDDTARRYADLGADRLVLYPGPIFSASRTVSFLERHADLASRMR